MCIQNTVSTILGFGIWARIKLYSSIFIRCVVLMCSAYDRFELDWSRKNYSFRLICFFAHFVLIIFTRFPELVLYNTGVNFSSGGKYSMMDRVVDGICLSVNSVMVYFKSHAFHASLQVCRIFSAVCPNFI